MKKKMIIVMSMILVVFSAVSFAGNTNFEKLIKDYQGTKLYESMDVSLEMAIDKFEGIDVSEEENKIIQDLLLNTSIKMNVKYDINTMKYYGNLILLRSDNPLWTFEFYYDDANKVLGVNSPLMYEKWIVLDENGINKAFGMDIGETMKLAFEEAKNAETMNISSLSEETLKEMTDLFAGNMTKWVTKEGKITFNSNNGSEIALDNYTLEFDMSNVIAFIEDYNNFLKTNKEVRDMLIDQIAAENNEFVDLGYLDETSRITPETVERIKAMEDPKYFENLYAQYDVTEVIDSSEFEELKDVIKFKLDMGFDKDMFLRKYTGVVKYHFPKELIEEANDLDMDLSFELKVDRINEAIKMPNVLKDYYNISYLNDEELEEFFTELQSNISVNMLFDEEGSKLIESINYLSEIMN